MCFGLKGWVSIIRDFECSSSATGRGGHTDSLLDRLFGVIGSLFTLFDTRSKGLSDLLVELRLVSTGSSSIRVKGILASRRQSRYSILDFTHVSGGLLDSLGD